MTPLVGEIFDEFVSVVRSLGRVEILAEKTRIAFHARMSFAIVVPRRQTLNGHLVLAERIDDQRFHRVTTFSARNHLHEFRLKSPADIDSAMRRWIAAAYDVGLQRHLRSNSGTDS